MTDWLGGAGRLAGPIEPGGGAPGLGRPLRCAPLGARAPRDAAV